MTENNDYNYSEKTDAGLMKRAQETIELGEQRLLSEHINPLVRLALLENSELDESILNMLATDSAPTVREKASTLLDKRRDQQAGESIRKILKM